MKGFVSVCTVLALLSCLWPLGASGGSPSSRGAAGDVLVYERQGWIWTCDGEGRGERRLVPGARPGVDPGGRLVAFFRPGSGDASELWVLDLERGSQARVHPTLMPVSGPVWLADSGRIALLVRDVRSMTSLVTLRAEGGAVQTLLREDGADVGYLCSLSLTSDGDLLTHDMAAAYWVDPSGGVRRRAALADIMGSAAGTVTSSDRLAACPTDPTVLVFSHGVPGTPRFERIMHEPSSALALHDSWTGKGKNMRITPQDVTAFDPVWSGDGRRVYFIGYRDVQAADADLFRVWRVDRFGANLKELVRGESVSVGSGAAAGR